MFFHSCKPVPGAMDNLSGVSVVLGIGKYLAENKSNSEVYPTHTKIYLISFAGEESGLRGAKRYVKAHYSELVDAQTKVVNMDGISKKNQLIIHNKESGIGANHDPEIYERLLKIANNFNIGVKLSALPFGATDGAVFSKKNISATSIGGLNLKEELAPSYHTRLDTPEVVEKEALGQVLHICLEYLKFIDKSQ
jgi:Zn-dependent M28 family amino/carboxypeptidase